MITLTIILWGGEVVFSTSSTHLISLSSFLLRIKRTHGTFPFSTICIDWLFHSHCLSLLPVITLALLICFLRFFISHSFALLTLKGLVGVRLVDFWIEWLQFTEFLYQNHHYHHYHHHHFLFNSLISKDIFLISFGILHFSCSCWDISLHFLSLLICKYTHWNNVSFLLLPLWPMLEDQPQWVLQSLVSKSCGLIPFANSRMVSDGEVGL